MKTYYVEVAGITALVHVRASCSEYARIWAQIQYHTTMVKVVS